MPALYNLIEKYINLLLAIFFEKDRLGRIQYTKFVRGPEEFKLIVEVLTLFLFLGFVLAFGKFMWNYGIVPAFPNVVARIDERQPGQASSSYVQLTLTVLALSMLF